MTTPSVTLEQYCTLAAEARTALRMIREVMEQHAPPGSDERRDERQGANNYWPLGDGHEGLVSVGRSHNGRPAR